jgi:hypothetical protein
MAQFVFCEVCGIYCVLCKYTFLAPWSCEDTGCNTTSSTLNIIFSSYNVFTCLCVLYKNSSFSCFIQGNIYKASSHQDFVYCWKQKVFKSCHMISHKHISATPLLIAVKTDNLTLKQKERQKRKRKRCIQLLYMCTDIIQNTLT